MFNQAAIREITKVLEEIKTEGGTTTDLPVQTIILLEELGYITDLRSGELVDQIADDEEYDRKYKNAILQRRRSVLGELGWFASAKMVDHVWTWRAKHYETGIAHESFSSANDAWGHMITILAPQWDEKAASRLIGVVDEYPINEV